MSFGWSAGDIASAIALLVKIGSALKESGGAATEYQEAIDFLSSIEKSLNGIKKLLDENADLTWESELNEQVVHVKAAVERFRAKIDKYDLSLGADSSRSTARKIPRKVQFALTADVKDFRNTILQSQIILDGFVNLQSLGSIVEHSRSTVLSFQKVETETQNLSQLVIDTVQLMEGHLRTQSQELQSVQEETKIAIQSQINVVKQHLQDLQALNISIAEQNKAGHLKLEADLRQSFQTLYACNKAYLNILLKKEEDQKNGMKASGQNLSFQSAMTSVVQIVGGGLAGSLGAIIAISSRNSAERNNTFPDSHQRGMVHNPSYAVPLRNSSVFSVPVMTDNSPMPTSKSSERVSCIVDMCNITFFRQADMERHLTEHHGQSNGATSLTVHGREQNAAPESKRT